MLKIILYGATVLISVGGVLLGIFGIAWIARWIDRDKKPHNQKQLGDLSHRAQQIFASILASSNNLDNFDLLTPESRRRVEQWLDAYRKVNSH